MDFAQALGFGSVCTVTQWQGLNKGEQQEFYLL
jgi:hypothetical protein